MENKLRSSLTEAKISILDEYKNCLVFEHGGVVRTIETIALQIVDIPTFVNNLKFDGIDKFVLHSLCCGKLRFCAWSTKKNVDPVIRERLMLLNLVKLHNINLCVKDFECDFTSKHPYQSQLAGKWNLSFFSWLIEEMKTRNHNSIDVCEVFDKSSGSRFHGADFVYVTYVL